MGVTSDTRTSLPGGALTNFAMTAFLIFTTLGPLTNSALDLVGIGDAVEDGNIFRQLGYVLVYSLALIAVKVWERPSALWSIPSAILIALAWFSMSVCWALNPGVSARRLALTAVVISNIFLLVQAAGYQRSVEMVRSILAVTLIANYIAIALWPEWAIHQDGMTGDENLGGTWRGIMMHKNNAGVVCAFAVIFFVFDARWIRSWWRYTLIVGAAYFLYRTSSKTSIGILGLSLCASTLYLWYDPYYRLVTGFLSASLIAAAGVLLYASSDTIALRFADENFLTGRAVIWPALIDYWQNNKTFGAGFGSFWDIGEPRIIERYVGGTAEWVASLASGHNGYLDVLVQTGLPGLVFAVCATVFAPLFSIFGNRFENKSAVALILCCVLFSIGHNFTESDLFQRDAIAHIYLMIALALLVCQRKCSNFAPCRSAI